MILWPPAIKHSGFMTNIPISRQISGLALVGAEGEAMCVLERFSGASMYRNQYRVFEE